MSIGTDPEHGSSCPGREADSALTSLDAAEADALDEGALEEEEEDDDRQDDQGRGGHEEAELDLALRLEEGQTDGEGVLGLVLEVDQGAEEVVPGVEAGEDADDADGGQRLGQDDLVEDAELAGAVDARRVRDLRAGSASGTGA